MLLTLISLRTGMKECENESSNWVSTLVLDFSVRS